MKSEKSHVQRLHARNRNRERYALDALVRTNPELGPFVRPTKYGEDSIDFSNPIAVRLLNKALLNHYYGIQSWEFPAENLCPPIPGRADYLHYMADLLSENNLGSIPMGEQIVCLDIGVGANCIYPIIGVVEYKWRFIGSDIDPKAIESVRNIVAANVSLRGKIDCKLQEDPKNIFIGIIDVADRIDLVICNPPFHSSLEEAQKATRRKVKNLSGKNMKKPRHNFAGISNELICEGGEYQFIQNMITESRGFSKGVYWFSTLVSKKSSLKGIYKVLKRNEANQVKTINMGSKNKSSRIVAWSFLSREERKDWRETRWRN